MERYVSTTYRLHEVHICAQGWYVTTTYRYNINDEKSIRYI